MPLFRGVAAPLVHVDGGDVVVRVDPLRRDAHEGLLPRRDRKAVVDHFGLRYRQVQQALQRVTQTGLAMMSSVGLTWDWDVPPSCSQYSK